MRSPLLEAQRHANTFRDVFPTALREAEGEWELADKAMVSGLNALLNIGLSIAESLSKLAEQAGA